ncbi:MAG: c-type cytochrome [Paenibacillaceae bacterium]|nr:c-type cytochrome [Paenibacillaceae bacterium]
MAHGHKSDEKVVYVGDSRVRQKSDRPLPIDYSAYPGKSEAFIPNFLLKEWMVAAVFLVGILVLVMSEPAPLGYPADPTNTHFIPMPDWYFLFMYQLLKYPYTAGDYKIFGTLVIPAIMFGSLLLAPFLDTGKERRFYRRPIASTLMFVSLIATIYLTVFSWHHYQKELDEKGIIPEHIERREAIEEAKKSGKPLPSSSTALPALVAADDPAKDIYAKATCVSCHGADLKGNKSAGFPALLGVGDTHDKAAILKIMKEGVGKMPADQYEASKKMGNFTDAQMEQLADWLAKQKKQS